MKCIFVSSIEAAHSAVLSLAQAVDCALYLEEIKSSSDAVTVKATVICRRLSVSTFLEKTLEWTRFSGNGLWQYEHCYASGGDSAVNFIRESLERLLTGEEVAKA